MFKRAVLVTSTRSLIKDQPSSYTPRRLDFHIIARSPTCGCKIEKLELKATQLLTMEPADKDATKKNQVSQDVGRAGFYGPDGKMKRGESIEGVAEAREPVLPGGS